MMMSREYNFVFIAGLKVASSSIEESLGKYADVLVRDTLFGKHTGIGEVYAQYCGMSPHADKEIHNFFKNATKIIVFREPVSLLDSIYRSHRKECFKGSIFYTGDMTFSQFLRSFRRISDWQLRPQIERMKMRDGSFFIDYIINFDFLESGLSELSDAIGIPHVSLPKNNISPAYKYSVPKRTLAEIREAYQDDFNLWNNYVSKQSVTRFPARDFSI